MERKTFNISAAKFETKKIVCLFFSTISKRTKFHSLSYFMRTYN
ncbi:uncharacterized protein G2W53_005581 [Senna tora]|uniref:Uncharacterized protein n=1 Tax=Senna tora TaxID=362788 RepID=A0A834X352_9FABA|nr:uncharacterized protein G2W53_005581 [Senna tora]